MPNVSVQIVFCRNFGFFLRKLNEGSTHSVNNEISKKSIFIKKKNKITLTEKNLSNFRVQVLLLTMESFCNGKSFKSKIYQLLPDMKN